MSVLKKSLAALGVCAVADPQLALNLLPQGQRNPPRSFTTF